MARKSLHVRIVDPTSQAAVGTFTFGRPTLLVEGKYKALGLWLVRLFTPRGTDPTDLSAGTDFGNLPGSNYTDVDEVETLLHTCVDDATTEAIRLQSGVAYLSRSERISTARITQFNVLGPGSFEIWVDLQVESGEAVRALIPYATE